MVSGDRAKLIDGGEPRCITYHNDGVSVDRARCEQLYLEHQFNNRDG
jgi:hypothetical protein